MKLPAALALLLSGSLAWAHPGGLDAKGCHTDERTGRVHCHKPKPAKAMSAYRCRPKRDADGRIKRDYRERRAFIERNPCPVTGSRSYRDSCQGWHVDHVVPLACCGADDPSNMRWTPAEENLAKGATCPVDAPAR